MTRLIGRALIGASVLAFAAAPAAAQRVDRIVAVGDSYADDGNAIQLGLVPPAFLPLYPTGRFTGGTNYVDTLAQLLNVPVDNFAIGGARANPDFLFEVNAFLTGGGGVFPTVSGTFDEDDLLTVSIGGNDARAYGSLPGATIGNAPTAAAPSIAAATAGLDALVAAGAPTISFLAGDTGRLPEVALDPTAAGLRTAFSTAFNSGMQTTLAGYADNGVIVHYLDLTLMLDQVQADLAAYGLTGLVCPAFPNPTCVMNAGQGFLFYGDLLHPTSQGSAIIAHYIATQLQAPLVMQAPSDLALDTARQFGRTLSSRAGLLGDGDDDLAQGMHLFVVGDSFSRDADRNDATDGFEIDGVGATAGVAYGFGNAVAGIAVNYSRPKTRHKAFDDDVRSWQIGGFAGASMGSGFANGYVGYGRDKHDLDREGVVEGMDASPKGSHWLAGAKAGYRMPMGAFKVGPVLALDYAKAKVNGYTEDGDPALTLNVGSVSAKSLTASLGAELSGELENSGAKLRPFASAAIEKDLLGDGRTVRFSQTSAPIIVNRWELEDRSKKAYARLSGGGSAALGSNLRLDTKVSGTFGRADGDEVSVHLGLNANF
jgi:outer membrane autotransporter protein